MVVRRRTREVLGTFERKMLRIIHGPLKVRHRIWKYNGGISMEVRHRTREVLGYFRKKDAENNLCTFAKTEGSGGIQNVLLDKTLKSFRTEFFLWVADAFEVCVHLSITVHEKMFDIREDRNLEADCQQKTLHNSWLQTKKGSHDVSNKINCSWSHTVE